MLRHVPILFGTTLAVLLVSATNVNAGLIYWSYAWSRTPTEILADAPGTSKITLSDSTLRVREGETDLVATNLRTVSTAPADNPDTFTHKTYTLSLYLLDHASGLDGTLEFTGYLEGKVSAFNVDVDNFFTGLTTQTLILGNHLYVVTIGPYTPVDAPDSDNAGAIGAHARVSIYTVPEPTGIALSSIGALVSAVYYLRGRNKKGTGHGAPLPNQPGN